MVSLGDAIVMCRRRISLTDHKILVQRQAFLLRGISPPSEQRFLLAGTRLSVCFVVGHLRKLSMPVVMECVLDVSAMNLLQTSKWTIAIRPATITTRHGTTSLTTHDLINKCCGDDSHLPLVHYASFVTDDV
jgi:hypothetical protein